MALRMKKMSDFMCDVLAGRHVHPISYVIGGMTKLPTEEGLLKVQKMLLDSRKDFADSVEIFKTLKFPEFQNPTQYCSLIQKDNYAFWMVTFISVQQRNRSTRRII